MSERHVVKQVADDDGDVVEVEVIVNEPDPKVNEERLYTSTDATVWAEEFAKVRPDVDRGLMIAWFANAIETAKRYAGGSW